MSPPMLKTVIAAATGAVMALWLAPAGAQAAGSIETVAQFYAGQAHLDLEIFHASDGSKLGMVTIENPLRIRGQPTASIVVQPRQWPELLALWAKARAGVTGAEPWTDIGQLTEIDGNPYPPRLSVSSGPDVRFALGQAGGAMTFELAASDLDAMEKALAREQARLQAKK